MSLSNNDKSDRGSSPTLIVTTVLVLLVVGMLGVTLFVMRSREQGRWRSPARALRAQEWVNKMDELGVDVQLPALHEIVVGGTTKTAHPRAGDLTKFNERIWNEFMPLSATRNIGAGTACHSTFQVVTLLRMPVPKLPTRTHRRQPTDTTLIDAPPKLDLCLAVYSSSCTIA